MSVLAILFVTIFALTAGQDASETYPESWFQIDPKSIIDNERLFMKYKKCWTEESSAGCPRSAMEIKSKLHLKDTSLIRVNVFDFL